VPTEVTWSTGATLVVIDTTVRPVSTPSTVVTAQVVTFVPSAPAVETTLWPTSRFASSTETAANGMGSATSTFVTTTTGLGVGFALAVAVALDLATSPAGWAVPPVAAPDAHDAVTSTVAASATPIITERTREFDMESP
jgi:hypothetical protein